jgi:Trk K+ transport system NAD-binding subunit
VGLAAAAYLNARGTDVAIVDKQERDAPPGVLRIHGDAADLAVLEKAGIRAAPSVLITTHDDDTNIYLTIYCRRLRPDIQIISRATLDRNVSVLHAAGADFVLSLVSMITNTIVNLLSPGKVFLLNEGLSIFRARINDSLAGKNLIDSNIRRDTHCNVVALRDREGNLRVNPDPGYHFQFGEELYLIGDSPSETSYYALYGHDTAVETGEN